MVTVAEAVVSEVCLLPPDWLVSTGDVAVLLTIGLTGLLTGGEMLRDEMAMVFSMKCTDYWTDSTALWFLCQ